MEITIQLPEAVDGVAVLGMAERNLKMIRESLGVKIGARDGRVRVEGEAGAVAAAREVIEGLVEEARRGRVPDRRGVVEAIAEAGWRLRGAIGLEGEDGAAAGLAAACGGSGAEMSDRLDVYAAGKRVGGRTANQREYLRAIGEHDLVFGIGPAGAGKTYLAVAAAMHMLKTGRVKRAVLARPAVEAGEKLGYLPGDQYAKVNPYLRPLIDALGEMMDAATIKRFLAAEIVEIVPLAFMRGRTLNDAVIILDEAQNTTRGQMQMFLTRMGQRSRMIVTGDVTQIDLEDPHESGLLDAARRLRRTPGVAFCRLDGSDVARHEMVRRVIEAYAAPPGEVGDAGEGGVAGGVESGNDGVWNPGTGATPAPPVFDCLAARLGGVAAGEGEDA